MTARFMLTTDAVGGVWSYTRAIAAGLAAAGHRCLIAVLGPAPDAAQCLAARAIPNVTLTHTTLPLDWTAPDEAAIAAAAGGLETLAAGFRADSVHLHSPAFAAFGWHRPVVAVAHSCVGTWWQAVREGPPPENLAWRMRLMQRGLAGAAAVIAPSAAFAQALRRVYGQRPALRVIHNGLAPPPAPAPAARQRQVLTAGRLWDRGKNIALLDQVAARLDAPIAAAGPASGPDGSAARFGHLHLLGTLAPAALQGAYARAAVFASPSLYEPFGLSVLEAAQHATPLALADIPTFRELWNGAALFLPPDDPGAWARALRDLLNQPDQQVALGQQAAARAAQYGLEPMVQATLNLHRDVLAAAFAPT